MRVGFETAGEPDVVLEAWTVLAEVVPQTGEEGPLFIVWPSESTGETGNFAQMLVE